jgi:hypothetical protein
MKKQHSIVCLIFSAMMIFALPNYVQAQSNQPDSARKTPLLFPIMASPGGFYVPSAGETSPYGYQIMTGMQSVPEQAYHIPVFIGLSLPNTFLRSDFSILRNEPSFIPDHRHFKMAVAGLYYGIEITDWLTVNPTVGVYGATWGLDRNSHIPGFLNAGYSSGLYLGMPMDIRIGRRTYRIDAGNLVPLIFKNLTPQPDAFLPPRQ